MVALLPSNASQVGADSRYLVTLSPKPQLALEAVRQRLGAEPVSGLKITWPLMFPGRVRKVISRSGVHRRYSVPCYRYGEREAHGDAVEEAAAFILLDACPGIEFQEQPARLQFEWLDRQRDHIPDILVAAGACCEFWECKRSSEADGFWIRKRSERVRELLMPLGVGYRVITGDLLYRGSFLANARILRRFAKHSVSDSVLAEATARTRAAGEVALGELAGFLAGKEPIADVFALLYAGRLRANLSQPLTGRTSIRLPSTEEEESWVWQLFDAVSV